MTTTQRSPCGPRRRAARPPDPPTRARRGAGRILGCLGRLVRGLLAAVVLTALVAALPWALIHYVGWPLPDHLPSWAELQGVLLGPMTTTFLLDFLACAIWLVWAVFVLDVARCGAAIAHDLRMPDLAAAGPVHRVAAVLVGALLIAILGHRAALSPASSTITSAPDTGWQVVATAPTWQQPDHNADIRLAAFAAPRHDPPLTLDQQPAPGRSAVVHCVVVLAPDPRTGVHDSLWRIAERTLGDGNRWPEIFALNKGRPQPNGGTFTRPSLIFPGEELVLPADATVPAAANHVPQPPPVPITPPPTTPAPAPSTPAIPPSPTPGASPSTIPPAPSAPQAPPSAHVTDEPGFRWGEELFVGLGLAAGVSAALAMARRRQRRRYRPGSGDRTDLPVAPVVYQLRLAHLRANHDDLDLDQPNHRRDEDGQAPAHPLVLHRRDAGDDQDTPILPVGVRDCREVALDLAATHGLGLIGAGALAAVRALLMTALTSTPAARQGNVRVLVPADDLASLLGRQAAQAPLPQRLRVVPDLTAALDELEAETLIRAGRPRPDGRPLLILVTRPSDRQHQRLQAVLDNGSSVGITGLLLGQWTPGATVYVRDDGTISSTSPGFGEQLRGTTAFRLADNHTTELLDLLRRADRHASSDLDQPADEVTADDDGAGDATAEMRPADVELEILGPAAPPSGMGPHLTPVHPGQAQVAPASAASAQPETQDGELATQGTASHGPSDVSEATNAASAPLRVSVLGAPRVFWRPAPAGDDAEREITSALQPRVRELLVFLALHPDGASREALIGALWPASPPQNTTNAMNTSLSRLRRSIATATSGAVADLVIVRDGRYRLDPELVQVDYHRFATAVTRRRTAMTDQDRIDAYRRIVASYTGPLADGLSTEWIETAREAVRRDAIDAVAALARALVDHDPQQTLDLLEMARAFDPHNELIYRDIMRLQERLGQLDAIPRTLALLTTRLAEIDDQPTPQAVALAERLQHRHDLTTDPGPANTRPTIAPKPDETSPGHAAIRR